MSSNLEQNQSRVSNRTEVNQSQNKNEFKLPKIPLASSQRGRLLSRQQNKPLIQNLPLIKKQSQELQDDRNFRNTQMAPKYKNKQNNIFNDEDFSIEVQQKLKMVLGNEDQSTKRSQQASPVQLLNAGKQENQAYNDMQIEDDLDFEEKISRNKQLIKMHKKKVENKINQSNNAAYSQKYSSNPKPKNKSKTMLSVAKPPKVQSSYQKKMKDYNSSLENKYVQRKKENLGIIAQKPMQFVQKNKQKKTASAKMSIDEVKADYGYQHFQQLKKQKAGKSNSKGKKAGNKSQRNVKNQIVTTQSSSPSHRDGKEGNIFDNIQYFLENPKAQNKYQKMYKQLLKKLKNKDISKLEEKVRAIDAKMGTSQFNETKSTNNAKEDQVNGSQKIFQQSAQVPFQRTARDWKRFESKNKTSFNCRESTFDKQIEYVGLLQQKNSESLIKFMDHQKIMVGLELQRRFNKSLSKD